MFQAIDKQTQLLVTSKTYKTEFEIYEELESLLKKRLEATPRGRGILASGKPLTKSFIGNYYQIRYAIGEWLKVEPDIFLPENDEPVVIFLKGGKQASVPKVGTYLADEGIFVADDREYDLCKVSEFLILPERNDDA